jgi:hypothetical protein
VDSYDDIGLQRDRCVDGLLAGQGQVLIAQRGGLRGPGEQDRDVDRAGAEGP